MEYKVLIVDDEKPARETLTQIINWEDTGFVIVDSAKNGKEALEKYHLHKPDLIITDIQMPIMDGLEFIRQVRLLDHNQKFVILSCHENFFYAREAIKMGVTDYLLKDLLTQQDIYSLLEKMRFDLDEKNFKHAPLTEPDRLYGSSSNRNEYISYALKSMLFEGTTQEKAEQYIQKFNMNLRSNYFTLLCIQVDDYQECIQGLNHVEKKYWQDSIQSLIKVSLRNMWGGECFYNDHGEFVALACLEDITSQLKLIADCHTICRTIREQVLRAKEITVTIGISKTFSNFLGLAERYSEAHKVTKLRVFMGKGKTLFYNTQIAKASSLNPDILDRRLNNIRTAWDRDDGGRLLKEIEKLYSEDLKGFMQYHYLKNANSNMFNIIMECCMKLGIGYEDIFGCSYIPVDQPDKLETIQEILEWYMDVFRRLIDIKSKMANKSYSRRVKDAIDYIDTHYNSDISLENISEELGLHKGYLCRLFKQETGENITDYIINFRIEKAKQLITSTNYKLYEISEMVGFSNPQQFSLNFKRMTGKTASEYREQGF